ncbi:coagulation factor V [Clupea harengus]|uniref:ferroxidase n=1 Tax=Clupea harengus TaxID=7950 RepID=A0A6P3W9H1_CLUHA|nr:coagulation factor V [Clupea harengus]
MRLCPLEGTSFAWLVLTLLSNAALAVERHYYIAAVNIDWDYSGQQRSGVIYKKAVYREYEDANFKKAKPHPPWLGLLGPTLRGQEGDVIVVTFRNMVDQPCNIHTHGVAYGKQSEGAFYFDNTSQKEKEDDIINSGGSHTYHWEVTSAVAPAADDPPCLTYTYFSHVDMVKDYNSGLIGTLLICKPGSLDDFGKQKHFHQESVLLFGVFDESFSWYSKGGPPSGERMKYTINGYTNGTVPGLNVCAYSSVSWHFLSMSSTPELFSIHFNGQVLTQDGHRVSSVGIISGTTTSASMTAVHTGRWLVSSHISKHLEAGMHGFLMVETCEGFSKPQRKLTIQQRRESQMWTYYIAAEEVIWDYTPNMPDYIDADFRSKYLKQGPDRIGKKYKKAVFTQYTDQTFTKRAENKQRKMELGILGPVIRAQIRDQIRIVFNNKATQPYSIYPHGLTIDKAGEGANYPQGGNQTHAVQPGETHTYVWNVIEEDEPLPSDPRCLTRMYHSAVNTPRDIASGLVGPLLICKSHSLNKRNVQLKADKEQHAMFAIFDENKSWYLDENIQEYCGDPPRVRKDAPDFYASNVMHTINGYMYESGQVLGFCFREIVTWHVSSIGEQNRIQTVTFYGHTFELNNREEDFLTLFPMTGETISMDMDSKGDWLLSSLNSHDTTKGMRVKFKDVECFRDYVYEYEDEDKEVYTVWKQEEYKSAPKEENDVTEEVVNPVTDIQTDYWAGLLDIRSHKESGNVSTTGMELVDLSQFDYVDDLPGKTSKKVRNGSDTEPITPSQAVMDVQGPVQGDPVSSVHTSVNATSNYTSSNDTSDSSDTQTNITAGSEYNESLSFVDPNMLLSNSSEVLDYTENGTRPSENVTAEGSVDSNKTNHSNTNMLLSNSSEVLDYTENGRRPSQNVTAERSVHSNKTDHSNTNMLLSNSSEVLDYTENGTQPSENVTAERSVHSNKTDHSNTNMLLSNSSEVLDYTENGRRPSQNVTAERSVHSNKTDHSNTNMLLSNSSEVLDYTENGTQPSENVTAEGSVDSNYVFTYSESSLESLTKSLNETDTEFVLLDGEAPTKISRGELEEEIVDPHMQGSLSLYNVTLTEPGDHDTTLAEGIADGTLSPEDTLMLNATDDTENGTASMTVIEEGDNETSLKVGVNMTHSSDNQINGLPQLNTSSSENRQHISSSNSESSDSISSERYGNDTQESDELNSSEEVVIYLGHNKNEGMRTNSLGPLKEHWGYEGKHTPTHMEIPEDITKYIPNETKPKKEPKKKVVHRRVRPFKGHAMRTRKKTEYKPQPKSSLSSRGFQPRGARPVSNEEDIVNNAIVIGLPRPEFNDYDLYAPLDDPQDKDTLSKEEYEYIEYKDPYSQPVLEEGMTLDETTQYFLKHVEKGTNVRQYFLSAEEVEWEYGGYGQRRSDMKSDGRPTSFTKVVYRGYLDPRFKTPDIRGEVDEHLGILGPVIRAEVGDTIMVVFRNLGSRPYSIHAKGVKYSKQMEGLSYVDGTPYWYQTDNAVQTNQTYTYMWKVSHKVGPKDGEPDCRTWAYYSGVNPERDIHSGLIGPLLICRSGTLGKKPLDTREFVLLFMTFDENKSWYYEKNYEMIQRRNKRTVMDPLFKENIKFPAINGIIYALKGLRMYTNQLANWHLLNMGEANDVHSIHFHGQTFLNHKGKLHRQGVFPLLPGGFATLQMWPSKPGLWLLESEVGLSQQRGMQTLFLVIDNDCGHPLGLVSGGVQDRQITASHTRGYWEPHLARLHNSGKYNAWSTDDTGSWIQVDFQRPVVISKVATQGAKEMFSSNYLVNYAISYSTDRRKWVFYKGDSDTVRKTFKGNEGAHEEKENIFYPPMIGRFVRLHPLQSYNKATVRMEYYGCELDGCSVPLGMKSGDIRDQQITASSTASNWYAGTWEAWLARVDRQGTVNAWQAKHNNRNQWLQIELSDVKKITGIITQGAKSMGTKMFVSAFTLQYSNDGIRWTKYTDDPDYEVKEFEGNTDNNDHKRNYIYPPIFTKFIRIVPSNWHKSITMRVELLGCDFE